MTDETANEVAGESPEESRRRKLDQITALGHDPWGHRFDDRAMLGDIRKRSGEVKYVLENGTQVDLPSEAEMESDGLKEWAKEKGKGALKGPQVRAAGRIVLHRDKGKLQFIDIEDWTGRIQLFVGQKQVGPENWELIQCLDLGDLIGVDGMLRRTQTGELSIFADKIHFLTKTLDPPPAKHLGLTDPEMRQRKRYVDLAYNEGVRDRFLDRSKIVRSVRETLAGAGLCRNRRPHVALDRRRCCGTTVHHPSQRAGHESVHADRIGATFKAFDGGRHGTCVRAWTSVSKRRHQS